MSCTWVVTTEEERRSRRSQSRVQARYARQRRRIERENTIAILALVCCILAAGCVPGILDAISQARIDRQRAQIIRIEAPLTGNTTPNSGIVAISYGEHSFAFRGTTVGEAQR